jgi:hypothetical protein
LRTSPQQPLPYFSPSVTSKKTETKKKRKKKEKERERERIEPENKQKMGKGNKAVVSSRSF